MLRRSLQRADTEISSQAWFPACAGKGNGGGGFASARAWLAAFMGKGKLKKVRQGTGVAAETGPAPKTVPARLNRLCRPGEQA